MKFIRIILGLILLGIVARYSHAADVAISALPAGTTLAGTEAMPAVQTGVTVKTTPSAISTYVNAHLVAFSGDCTTPGGSGVITCTKINGVTASTGSANQAWMTPNGSSGATALRALVGADIPAINVGSHGAGGITGSLALSDLATQVANTIDCNATTGAAVPTACNPLAVANMMSAMFSVTVAATGNVATLSGTQTIDGTGLLVGQTVLLPLQTTSSQNGIYVVQSGAWTRAINFPTGYVTAIGCDIAVFSRQGTLNGGHTFRLSTSSAITIGTSGQNWTDATPIGSPTHGGLVFAASSTTATNLAATIDITTPPSGGDCFSGSLGAAGAIVDIGDIAGNKGYCATIDPTNGYLNLPGDGTAPSITGGGGGGTIAAYPNSSNQHGRITGMTAATSVTITFTQTWPRTPDCGGSTSTATAVGVSAVSTSAVTFSMTALTGSLNYWCF